MQDLAVDAVDEHEAALARRVLGRVQQDAPRGPAAQAAPPELGRRVPDREPDLAGRGDERVGVLDRERPGRGEVVGPEEGEADGGAEET